jgi:hypothetical protein
MASWVGELITIGAAISAFGCALACAVGAARLLFALSRDGVRLAASARGLTGARNSGPGDRGSRHRHVCGHCSHMVRTARNVPQHLALPDRYRRRLSRSIRAVAARRRGLGVRAPRSGPQCRSPSHHRGRTECEVAVEAVIGNCNVAGEPDVWRWSDPGKDCHRARRCHARQPLDPSCRLRHHPNRSTQRPSGQQRPTRPVCGSGLGTPLIHRDVRSLHRLIKCQLFRCHARKVTHDRAADELFQPDRTVRASSARLKPGRATASRRWRGTATRRPNTW